ncbi:MAG: hypothetical protein RL885_24915 [Planctomycetota bacterium]
MPDIDGLDDQDRADDAELGPDVDAGQLRRKQAAWCVQRQAEGGKAPKDLRRAFYRPAQPHLNDEGGWLVREQAAAAEGRSRFPRDGVVSDGAAGCDPLAQFRLDMPGKGSWPMDRRGWDENRDGEWFSLQKAHQRGEFFYVAPDGGIRAQTQGGSAGGVLRRATLEELFGWFAEPGRDPEVGEKWLVEIAYAGQRVRDYAERIRRMRRGRQSRETAEATRGGPPSSLGEMFGAPLPGPDQDRPPVSSPGSAPHRETVQLRRVD